jgi:hypothetical protein
MRAWVLAALTTGAGMVAAPPASAQVSLTIDDGYVTLSAKEVTVRQILAEWSRVGQTKVVNGDRISGTPITLQLIKVPEAEALEILLRSVSGYLAAPRAVEVGNASRFDRILVMPTSTPPRAPAPSPASAPQQAFQPPQLPEDMDVEEPVMQAPPGAGPQRGPVFSPFPNAGGPPMNGAGQPSPNPYPQPNGQFPQPNGPFPQAIPPVQGFTPPNQVPGGMPVGVSTPGMMVMPPQPAVSPNDPQP